jgi:competence protein ComEA
MESESKEQVGRSRRARDVRRLVAAALVALTVAAAGSAASARENGTPRVDLNSASVEELMSLPGVGASKAQAIVEHRRTAPFRKVEELLEVKGIGDSIYAGLRDRITVSAEAAPGEPKDSAAPGSAIAGED